MQVLAIIGSPRKRNTLRFVQRFEALVKKRAEAEFEYLFVKDYDIGLCRGCMACVRKGEERCPHHAPVGEILARMEAADAIVLASPVFCNMAPGILKNLVDHFIYVIHRPRLMHKYAFVLVTTQYSGLKETERFLLDNAMKWGCIPAGRFGVRSMAFEFDPTYRRTKGRELERKADAFSRAIRTGKLPPVRLADAIYFRVWQEYIRLSEDISALSRIDFDYWKERGMLDKDHFYDGRIDLAKTVAARLIARNARRTMQRIFQGYRGEAAKE